MVYNSNVELQAKYNYDAFGNATVCNPDGTVNTSTTFIGNLNPIRYKGYYFDTETNLYYLQSRYYDSETGRFISPDDVSFLDPNALGGMNLYAYCLNNPVMNYDPSGHFVISMGLAMLLGFIVGGLVSAATSVVTQAINYGWENINGWQVLVDGLIGGVVSMLSMTPIGVGGQIIIGMIGGIGSYMADGTAHNKTPTWGGVLLAAGLGALFGGIGGNGLAKKVVINNIAKKVVNGSMLSAFSITGKSALVSSGVNVGISGINRVFDYLTGGEWTRVTGLQIG